jgi:hypothetical protein
MKDRPVMTDDEMIKDYPRLKLEYTRLHEDFRRLQSKQLIIGDVMVSACKGGYLLKDNDCKKYGGVCVKHNCDYWQAEP